MIIDAHQHFWDPAQADYPFLEDVPGLCRRFGPEDLQPELESNEIDASIVVQARSSHDETEQLQLAKLPNVFCKLSGLLTETSHLAADGLAAREAVVRFGADRCMFGSVGRCAGWRRVTPSPSTSSPRSCRRCHPNRAC